MSSKIDEIRAKAKEAGELYVTRNDQCPCGSGKKAKKCHLKVIQAISLLPPAVREQMASDRLLAEGAFKKPEPMVPPAIAEKFAEASQCEP